MRLWIQYEYFSTYYCSLLYKIISSSFGAVSNRFRPFISFSHQRHPKHGSETRIEIKNGLRSLHNRSPTYFSPNVQTLLLHSILKFNTLVIVNINIIFYLYFSLVLYVNLLCLKNYSPLPAKLKKFLKLL